MATPAPTNGTAAPTPSPTASLAGQGVSGTPEFLTALATAAIVGSIFLCLFCVLRPKLPHVYARKCSAKHGAPCLPNSFLGWTAVLFLADEAIIKYAGLDSLVYLMFFKMAATFFGGIMLFGIIVMLPVYVTGYNDYEGFNRLSLSNLEDKSPRFALCLISIWLFSFFFYYLLRKNYQKYLKLRHTYLSLRAPPQLSLVVTGIPEQQRSSQHLANIFDTVVPGSLQSSTIPFDYSAVDNKEDNLDVIVAERKELVNKYLHALACEEADGKRPMHKTGLFGCVGEKVDSIDWYAQKIEQHTTRAKAARQQQVPPLPVAFVTFASHSALLAADQQTVSDAFSHRVEPAPSPEDILWANVKVTYAQSVVRSLLVYVFLCLLTLLWTIPVGFVSSLTTLENLQALLPFLEPVLDFSPTLKGIIQGVLPTLALTIFLAIIPMIMKALATAEGHLKKSTVDNYVLAHMFVFQLWNVFFVLIIGSLVFDALSEGVDSLAKLAADPLELIRMLGESLPQVATFFTNYVALNGFIGFPSELLQLSTVVIDSLKRRYICKNEAERVALSAPSPSSFGVSGARGNLIFLLGIVFSSINPLILPFAFLYFAFAYAASLYQYVYVYAQGYESGGLLFPVLANRMIAAFMVYQIAFIAYFPTRLAFVESGLTVPLPFLTMATWWYCRANFEKPAQRLPTFVAATLPRSTEDEEEGFAWADCYKNPSTTCDLLSVQELSTVVAFDVDANVGDNNASSANDDMGTFINNEVPSPSESEGPNAPLLA